MAAGQYSIRADLPEGSPIEAGATFTLVPMPSITIDPVSGPGGTTITITGSGFVPDTGGSVFFDIGGAGDYVTGPYQWCQIGPDGSFTTTLQVPPVWGGYPGAIAVLADFPPGQPVEASAIFTIVARRISLDPSPGLRAPT